MRRPSIRLVSTLVALGAATALIASAGSASAKVFLPPQIDSFSPASAPVGARITITGANFTGTSVVRFGGVAALFTIHSDTSITATVPPNATTGAIKVENPAGSATSSSTFKVLPKITSVNPSLALPGKLVKINGTTLGGTTAVYFGSVAADMTTAVVSSSSIKVSVPAGASTGKISITTPAGTATSPANFTVIKPPTVTSFSPTSGAVGAKITITGTSFTGVTLVKFNGASARFHIVSDTSITAIVPPAATTGKISVRTPTVHATSSADFGVLPTITSFSPASGRVGATVTITGTGFGGTTAVYFGSVAADMASAIVSSTSITCTVPPGATTGKISVTTAAGTVPSRLAFTVQP